MFTLASHLHMTTDTKKKAYWFVFYTASRHEKKAAEILHKHGYDAFVPVITELKQWSDRKKKVQSPLFKGYLFVKIAEHEIPQVVGYPGVSFALKMGGKYAKVREEEIEAIKRLIYSGIYAEAIPSDISGGDKVIVNEGPLKGMKGICREEAAQNYFLIEVPSINHLIKVKIHASALKRDKYN